MEQIKSSKESPTDRRLTAAEYEQMREEVKHLDTNFAKAVNSGETEPHLEVVDGKPLALKVYDKSGNLIYFEDVVALQKLQKNLPRRERSN